MVGSQTFRKTHKAVFAVVAAMVLAAVGVLFAPSAAADTSDVRLNGAWAPYTRCPVDDPAMLAADGRDTIASCNAALSPSGSIKLGNITASTGRTNLQFGVLLHTGGNPEIVSPAGGALVAEPVPVPGGLLGLMCPSDIPVITDVCEYIRDNDLNAVTAVVEPAGEPSDFNVAAGTSQGEPILTLPIKIHLQNPLLGSDCYIGSNSNPIVLHPQNLTQPAGKFVRFDQDGTPNPTGDMAKVVIDSTQGDDSFAVPGAQGCGPGGLFDLAVNLKVGLPSPAGNNSLVLNDATTHALGGFFLPHEFAPNQGQALSDAWHSAVLP